MSIIDRRPEKPYKIEDVIYFKINFEKGDDGDSIDKTKMREEIKDRLKGKVEVSDKLNVRFSQNYAETQRKGAPEGVTYVMDKDWQSWNSIDLPILKKGSVICDEKELTDYAFLIPWKQKKCYIILYQKRKNCNLFEIIKTLKIKCIESLIFTLHIVIMKVPIFKMYL